MSFDLPAPLSSYFQAKNAHDVDSMLAAFADDARVHDEKQDIVGRAAIREWLETTTRQYRDTATPLAVAEAGGKTVVTARVAGTFPGSPIELTFRFTVTGGKIARLDIG